MESAFVTFLAHYGIFGVFISVAVESLSIPFPTEGAYIVGQTLVSQGHYSLSAIFAILLSGHLFGSLLSYAAGYRLANSRVATSNNLNSVQKRLVGWYSKYGFLTVFTTRLIGYVRPWSSFAAGFAKVPLVPFLFFNALGSAIIISLCLAFTNSLAFIWKEYPASRWLIGLSVSIGFIFLIIQFLLELAKRPKSEKPAS